MSSNEPNIKYKSFDFVCPFPLVTQPAKSTSRSGVGQSRTIWIRRRPKTGSGSEVSQLAIATVGPVVAAGATSSGDGRRDVERNHAAAGALLVTKEEMRRPVG
jgi:hypothetical protein